MDRREFLKCFGASFIPIPSREFTEFQKNMDVGHDSGNQDGERGRFVRCSISALANAVRIELLQVIMITLAWGDGEATQKIIALCEEYDQQQARGTHNFKQMIGNVLRDMPGIYALIRYGEILPMISGLASNLFTVAIAKIMREKAERILEDERE